MSTYIVTKVRMESCGDRVHQHIEGVCTDTGTHYSRKEVADSITAGNTWKTSAGGYEAVIHKVSTCRRCPATPYIETNPDSSKLDNLDNLPRC